MKKGDKLICKKDYKIFFSVGQSYIIDYIFKSYTPNTIIIKGDDNTTIGFNGKEMPLFEDYFDTVKEIRKMKIKNLENVIKLKYQQ